MRYYLMALIILLNLGCTAIPPSKEVRTLTGHQEAVTAIAFSPDNHLLASASMDTTVRFWEVDSGQSSRTLKGEPKKWANCLVFSPDGKLLAAGGGGQGIFREHVSPTFRS